MLGPSSLKNIHIYLVCIDNLLISHGSLLTENMQCCSTGHLCDLKKHAYSFFSVAGKINPKAVSGVNMFELMLILKVICRL